MFSFSNEEEFNLLFNDEYSFTDTNLIDSFKDSIFIDTTEDLTKDLVENPINILIMNEDLGISSINQLIFSYIPKGTNF